MQIKEFMKTPYVIDKDVSLIDAAKLMSAKRIGSLIFVLKGKIKGIITESDMLKNFGKNKKVSDIMSKNIITISDDYSMEDALKIMKDNKIKRLPVIDKGKNLVGIVTMTDLAANIDKSDEEFFFN